MLGAVLCELLTAW